MCLALFACGQTKSAAARSGDRAEALAPQGREQLLPQEELREVSSCNAKYGMVHRYLVHVCEWEGFVFVRFEGCRYHHARVVRVLLLSACDAGSRERCLRFLRGLAGATPATPCANQQHSMEFIQAGVAMGVSTPPSSLPPLTAFGVKASKRVMA